MPPPTTGPLPLSDAAFDIVALAASAGGVQALREILTGLPADFPAALAVVLHRPAGFHGLLADVLGRRTLLRVKEAEEGERLAARTVFLAPPGFHLLVTPRGTLSLSVGPKVNHVRPSAEPLFLSMAASCEARAVAVVLTGGDGDGSDGVREVKRRGGVVIVQDPAEAEAPGMPRSAIATGCADQVLPLAEIASALVRLVRPARV